MTAANRPDTPLTTSTHTASVPASPPSRVMPNLIRHLSVVPRVVCAVMLNLFQHLSRNPRRNCRVCRHAELVSASQPHRNPPMKEILEQVQDDVRQPTRHPTDNIYPHRLRTRQPAPARHAELDSASRRCAACRVCRHAELVSASQPNRNPPMKEILEQVQDDVRQPPRHTTDNIYPHRPTPPKPTYARDPGSSPG